MENLQIQIPSGISSMTTEEAITGKLDTLNLSCGELKDLDCPICKNKGLVWYAIGDDLRSRECECMTKRRTLSRLRKSGLSELVSNYTFEAYKTDTATTENVKRKAAEYAENKKGWFFVSGNAGSGKTHICTAICGRLIAEGKALRYMLWREEAPKLKALVNDRYQYDALMDELKGIEVLYIDDFFKGNVTEADINLAFELLNHRYNRPSLLTIISSELPIENILSLDEAIGSRIYERSKGYCLKAPSVNRRLSNG